jgi:hypothetical protein
MKKPEKPKKLVVGMQTVRALQTEKLTQVAAAGGAFTMPLRQCGPGSAGCTI